MASAPDTASRLVTWLRAAGETTRLRLLALCADRDLSVSDLAAALHQSEPRVSRHLKILSEAELIVRSRQGQWVHYRVAREGAAAAFVQGLLAQLDRNDAFFARDRENLRAQGANASRLAIADARLGRTLRAFMEADSSAAAVSSILILGVEHLELLSVCAGTAKKCVAVAHSRRAAQTARSFAERESLHCRVEVATAESVNTRDTERAGQPFEAIVLDRLTLSPQKLTADLAVVRQALRPGGHLWLFERYESLERSRGRVVDHPIGKLRRILSEAGFTCERLSPIEADGEHVLAVRATLAQESSVRVA